MSPLGLRKCFTELGQAIQGSNAAHHYVASYPCLGWLALPRDAAVQAMGPAIQAMRPTLRALGVSSHSTRLCATPPADSLEAARQLYRIVTLLQTVALRPRMKFGAPASYIWIDDKVGNNHAEVEYITSRGAKPLQATTTQKAMELARQVGEENLGFITNSFRKDDGREKTVQNLLDVRTASPRPRSRSVQAIRAEKMPMTPVLVYMGTDPAAFYLPMQAKQPLLLATMDAAVLRLFGDASFPLYDAEKLVDTIDQVLITTGAKHRAAQLLLTNFRLIFLDSPPFTTSQPWALLMEVPLGAVYKTEESAEKESGRVQVKLYCRDFRTLSFVLPRKNVKFSKTVTSYNTETMLATSMAGQFELESEDLSHPASWHIYSQGWDFERTFCTQSPHWTLHNQRDFDVCANYPENIVLPTGLSSADINALRKGRHYGALPTLSFYYRKNGAAVLRAASEALDLGEALGRPGDASILEKCIGLMGQRAVTIVDVGVTRVANVRASTMPSTVSRQYLDLGNTQDITNTLRKLLALRKTMLVGEWIESLSQIGYLELLQRILTCAQSLASMVMVRSLTLWVLSRISNTLPPPPVWHHDHRAVGRRRRHVGAARLAGGAPPRPLLPHARRLRLRRGARVAAARLVAGLEAEAEQVERRAAPRRALRRVPRLRVAAVVPRPHGVPVQRGVPPLPARQPLQRPLRHLSRLLRVRAPEAQDLAANLLDLAVRCSRSHLTDC